MEYKDLGYGFISIPYTEPKVYQQGWVCPKCGGVYSPSQHCCPNCTPAQPIKFTCDTGKPAFNKFTTTTGTTSQDLCSGINFDVRYNVAPQPKRGRGRPRIHPIKTEKRPVGRPKKIVK